MTEATSLDVRNGAWVHVPASDADGRSADQQTRDRLLRDLALAIHYNRITPTQGEHTPRLQNDTEPYVANVDIDGEQIAPILREIRALLGEPAAAELLAAASYLAETKPGQ